MATTKRRGRKNSPRKLWDIFSTSPGEGIATTTSTGQTIVDANELFEDPDVQKVIQDLKKYTFIDDPMERKPT